MNSIINILFVFVLGTTIYTLALGSQPSNTINALGHSSQFVGDINHPPQKIIDKCHGGCYVVTQEEILHSLKKSYEKGVRDGTTEKHQSKGI